MPPEAAPARPVFLIGMMGCGKSTVGKRLAGTLGREFVDADRELEARLGVPIPTIFELEGEDGFRRREAQLIDELTQRPGLVLATGGGAVLREENRRALHDRGVAVYLRAQLPELWQRLRHDRQRPLLQTANPRQRIGELLALRDPLYQATAHVVIHTGRQPVERVVADIIDALDSPETPVGTHRRPG